MNNMTVTPKGDKLIIEVDISKGAFAAAKPSASGKTKVFATTGGNQSIALPSGQTIHLGLNAYIK